MIKRTTSLAPLGAGQGLKTSYYSFLRCPLPVNFLGMGGGGRLPPAIPGEDIKEVKYSNKRTNVVRLLPNGFQERKLRRLADASAKLFNEVNYERRQQFFHGGKVDLKGTYEVLWEV